MAIRAGWLPNGSQGAEDTRAATGMILMPSGLVVPQAAAIPTVSTAQAFALTSTGSLSCSVGPGQGIVVPGQTNVQGAYPVTVDASGSGLPTVSFAAGGSLARTDVIYLQVQDTAEDGSGITAPKVAVVQGTNGGGIPAVPAGALAVWDVPVPASATSINFATAQFVAPPTVALGGVIPSNNSGFPAAAIKGQVRARTDRAGTAVPGPLEVWDGAAWNSAVPALMPRGIMAAPISTGTNGTPSSGSSDTIDTVLGNYVFTATAGRRYRVVMNNLVANGNIASDIYALRVRDSGSISTPTASSPAVIDSVWTVTTANISGRTPLTLEDTFLCTTSGPHTLAFFSQRVSGTGGFTPLSPAGNSGTGMRKIWVEDAGNV